MPSQKTVYVVDDHEEFRRSLAALLSLHEWRVQAFASSAGFLDAHAGLEPGVLLLDLRMPGPGGQHVLEQIDPQRFATIVLTGHGDVRSAVRALKAGAFEFIEKPFRSRDLLGVVDAAWALLGHRLIAVEDCARDRRLLAGLSARERQVLEGILAACSNKQIAHGLDLSVRTVELYRARMMIKLNVRHSAELFRFSTLLHHEPGLAHHAT